MFSITVKVNDLRLLYTGGEASDNNSILINGFMKPLPKLVIRAGLGKIEER